MSMVYAADACPVCHSHKCECLPKRPPGRPALPLAEKRVVVAMRLLPAHAVKLDIVGRREAASILAEWLDSEIPDASPPVVPPRSTI